LLLLCQIDFGVVAQMKKDELLINIHIVSTGINISVRMMTVIILLFLLNQPKLLNSF